MDTPLTSSDPAVMMGKPIVTGTRITVELILRKLGAGERVEQLLEMRPAQPALPGFCLPV